MDGAEALTASGLERADALEVLHADALHVLRAARVDVAGLVLVRGERFMGPEVLAGVTNAAGGAAAGIPGTPGRRRCGS